MANNKVTKSADDSIKDADKKCYVLILSRHFPKSHPCAWELTWFFESIAEGEKIHTIRGNYDLWKKRIDEVNEGKAYISRRYWSSKPYNSKQIEFDRLYKAGIQRIQLERNMAFVRIESSKNSAFSVVANNDGLSISNMYDWFFIQKKENVLNKAIIHFTNFRY